jgi:hypothetical protein
MTRRRWILCGLSAAFAIGVAVAAWTLAWNPDYAVRRAAVERLPPPTPRPSAEVRVLLTSDFGHQRSIQRGRLLGEMRVRQAATPFDLVLVAGDNVDGCGPDVTQAGAAACEFGPDGNTVALGFAPPPDPVFGRMHDDAFATLGASGPASAPPVFVALGNHDVASGGKCAVDGLDDARTARLRACLEVAHQAPTWHMPGRHYAVDAGPIRLIVIDGNLLKGEYGGFRFDDEEAFVRKASEPCGERLCFLVSHYPPATGGIERRREPALFLRRVAAIERAAGGRARAWLSGHHHDLQQLRTPSGLDAFVFGNSSAARGVRHEVTTPDGAEQLFFSTSWGAAILEAAGDRWWFRFEDVQGRALHCCAAAGAGRCEPEACEPAREVPIPGARVTTFAR